MPFDHDDSDRSSGRDEAGRAQPPRGADIPRGTDEHAGPSDARKAARRKDSFADTEIAADERDQGHTRRESAESSDNRPISDS